MMWRQVPEGYKSKMGHDGTTHYALYDGYRLLSFIWDGEAEWIEVSQGGYGEPVEWLIPAFPIIGTPAEIAQAYREHCWAMIPEWDETIWDDNDFGYHDIHPHCAISESHVPVPSGKPIHGYEPGVGNVTRVA